MRKGTKKIRKVNTGTNEYYIYDLDMDAFGKQKRIYGKTEGEVKLKIEAALKEREEIVSVYKPKTKKLSDYVTYYFKKAVGQIAAGDLKSKISLFERVVFGSKLDRDIDTISEADIQEFYESLVEKYPLSSIEKIDAVLQKTFAISNTEGTTNLSFDNIKLPAEINDGTEDYYILTPKEFEELLSFCIADNCTRYGSNELIIVFSMMTGIKFSDLKTIQNKDVDLAKGTVFCAGRTVQLSDKCREWLKHQADEGRLLSSAPMEGDGAGISRYTCDGESLLFVNSKGLSPTIQGIQYTMNSITKRCGLPKGIKGKTLCKSYVIYELENGTTAEELSRQLGYKTSRPINDIRDEYEVRKRLF